MSKKEYKGAKAMYNFSAKEMYHLYRKAYIEGYAKSVSEDSDITVDKMNKEARMKKDVEIAASIIGECYQDFLDKKVFPISLYLHAASEIHKDFLKNKYAKSKQGEFCWQQSSYENVGAEYLSSLLTYVIPVFEEFGIKFDYNKFKDYYGEVVKQHLKKYPTVKQREEYEVKEFNWTLGCAAVVDANKDAFLDAVRKSPGYCKTNNRLAALLAF